MSTSMRNRRTGSRTALAVAAFFAGALLLTACSPGGSSGDVPAASETPASPEASDAPATEDDAPATEDGSEGTLNARAAAEAALRTVPGAIVEVELGRKGTTITWEVGVLAEDGSGVELYIDARSGEVLRQDTLSLDSEQRTAPAVTAAEAIDIALGAVPGRVTAADLGTERGQVVWEIDVIGTSGSMELYIDATTGEVLKQERG